MNNFWMTVLAAWLGTFLSLPTIWLALTIKDEWYPRLYFAIKRKWWAYQKGKSRSGEDGT